LTCVPPGNVPATTPKGAPVTARRDLGRLQGEIQELLADLWQVPRVAGLRRGFRPPADCFRTEDPPKLVVVVDIAGVAPEQVHILVAKGILVVSGERRPSAEGRPSYRQIEIDYGPFQRQIVLGDEVDAKAARASYEQGLLTIVLPLTKKARSSGKATIEVKARR
jgi:HSP20 family protein